MIKGDNMKGRRKYKVYIIIAIVLIVLFLFAYFFILKRDNQIIIKNNTDVTLSRLSIIYKYSDKEKVIELPEIDSKDNYKMKLLFPEGFSEGAIKIEYFNKQGLKQEEYIMGYIEKGNHNNIIAKINSVDSKGILSINIE